MSSRSRTLNVVELFAGVGGFRLGLERANAKQDNGAKLQVGWSNQWEPSNRHQYASKAYVRNFGPGGHVCHDISSYLDWEIDNIGNIPSEAQIHLPRNVDLLVGGFPCQDYSVAKPLSQSSGLQGKKGVLWWEIYRLLEHKEPRYVLLENVDRLIQSPGDNRGKDFAVILSCLNFLGYTVQWRVINAADYGFPQRRRRVFILAEKGKPRNSSRLNPADVLSKTCLFASAFPVLPLEPEEIRHFTLPANPYITSSTFVGNAKTIWGSAGFMIDGEVHTADISSNFEGELVTLSSILEKGRVEKDFYILPDKLSTWRFLKGSKKLDRINRRTGHHYTYAEGAVKFPDPLNSPSRTILTSEGGHSPSRTKHVIQTKGGKLRRLTPIELERLQGFPDNWTMYDDKGQLLSPATRAFFMGNALVVGVVDIIGQKLLFSTNNRRHTLNL